jgi:hypothetical protein
MYEEKDQLKEATLRILHELPHDRMHSEEEAAGSLSVSVRCTAKHLLTVLFFAGRCAMLQSLGHLIS